MVRRTGFRPTPAEGLRPAGRCQVSPIAGVRWAPWGSRNRTGFRLLLLGLLLLLAPGAWRPAPALAQLPAGTPVYSVNAKWVTDHGSQLYNIKSFGAVGDGSTDDTAAIQAGLNQVCGVPGVGPGMGNLFFPLGTYKITSTLYCYANPSYSSRISGAVGGDSGNQSTIIWAGASGGTMIVLMGWRQSVVENLNFNCAGIAKYGIVVTATNTINTTLGTAVTSPGSVTFTPGSMSGIEPPANQYPGTILNVDTGANFEVVFVTATTTGTATATFAKTHLATAPVGNSGNSGGSGLFESVSVFNATGGTYSAGWLVGNHYDADLAGIHWDHCYVGQANSSIAGYAGILFIKAQNVMNFSWKKGWFIGLQHGIDAAGYFGYLDVEDGNAEGDTVSDFLFGSDQHNQYRISSFRTELASGAAFIGSAGSTTSPGSLEINGVSVNEGATAPTNDCVVNWMGGMRITGSVFYTSPGHIAKVCAGANAFQNSQNQGGVTLIGNQFQGVTSGPPPVYGNAGANLAYGNAAVYALANWGLSSDGSTTSRLQDYQAVGILADESQSGAVSSSAVLNGGNTSCLLGWENNAANGAITVCKNTSDQLQIAGATGISLPGHVGSATADTAGSVTITSSTSATVNFGTSYGSAPKCVVIPASDPTSVGAFWVTSTTTGLTVNVHTPGTITFNYVCVGI